MKTEKEKIIERIKNEITTYPFDVIDGQVVTCTYIRLACQRFINWLNLEDRYFDVDAVLKVINFIEKLQHFKGQFAGQNFKLENWQKWIIATIYGFKWKKNNLRVIRTFILSIGRKNGKSSLIAAMALYHLIGDGEASAEVVACANSSAQASILFKMCSNYLKKLDKKGKYFQFYRDSINFPITDSTLKIVSSDASRLDGLNVSFAVEDETGAAPSSELWDVLETSQGSRLQPLICSCSTRGFQLNGFYKELEQTGIDVLNGIKEDDSLFTAIYTLDDDDDYKDDKNWIKANPNLGISINEEFLTQQIKKCENNPIQEVSIRTKLFNQWVSSSSTWIPLQNVANLMQVVDLQQYKGMFAYLSFDLAAVSDLTALSIMIQIDDKYIYKTYYYLPESCLKDNVNSQLYREWHKGGYLTVTSGNVTDYNYVFNDIKKLQNTLLINKISYDDWNSRDFVIKCTENGMPMCPYSQSIGSMNRPTKELQRLILSGKVIIDKNPITLFCFENSVPKMDWNDNVKIVKNTPMQKIDGVIVMIMALGGYLQEVHYDNEISVSKFE